VQLVLRHLQIALYSQQAILELGLVARGGLVLGGRCEEGFVQKQEVALQGLDQFVRGGKVGVGGGELGLEGKEGGF
jgi:hypothetical protein